MQWHIETDIITIIMLVSMFISMNIEMKRKTNRDTRFYACVWISFMTTLIDIFASIVFSIKVSKEIFIFAQTLYNATHILAVISWQHYAISIFAKDNKKLIKITDIVSAICYAVYVVFVIINCWTGYLFTYDVVSGYSRGPLFFVPLMIVALYVFTILLEMIWQKKQIADRNLFIVLIAVPLLSGIGIALQLLVEGWLMISPFFALGLLVTYMIIHHNQTGEKVKTLSEVAYHDNLTGLFSREYAEHEIDKFFSCGKDNSCMLIMADLDNLKTINDSYGHPAGDEALKHFGKLLNEIFSNDSIVARYGGDEFMIFQPYYDIEKVKVKLSKLIISLSKTIIADYPNMKLTCSAGVSFSTPEKQNDFTTMLREADIAMYEVKKRGKNDFDFYKSTLPIDERKYIRIDSNAYKHVDWFDNNEMHRLFEVLSDYMPYIISVNISTNNYYAIENNSNLSDNIQLYGEYDEFVKKAIKYFHPDDAKEMQKKFDRNCLLSAYESGQKSISQVVRHRSSDGSYKWTLILCMFSYSESINKHCYIILRSFNEEHSQEIERKRLLKVFELAIQKSFEYICVLDAKTGKYSICGNDGNNTHNVMSEGVYDEIIKIIANGFVKNNEKEDFIKKSCFSSVLSHMKNDDFYSYRYHTETEMRECSFYYIDEDKNEILFIVSKL